MWDLIKEKLSYISFYHFCLIFLATCFAYDVFVVQSITGFTFGYAGAFVYMYFRMKEAKQWIEDHKDD
jgi:hypothetical protein